MINRYNLRYFLAVVDTGNFSRAAAQMNVTQPTLSVGLAKLEKDLGAKLFFRNNRRVHLTEAGSRLLEHARAIEQEFAKVEQGVGRLQPRRLTRLGVLSTIPTPLIEKVVRRHQGLEPRERLEIVEGPERDLMAQLDRGRIDLALTLLRSEPGRFAQEWLYSEGYALAVPRSHRHADAESVNAEDLGEEVMIVRRHCEALSATSRHFTERGVRPEFSFRSANDDKVLALVRAGLGITLMPESYVDPGIRRPRLAGFTLRREVGLIFSDRGVALKDEEGSAVTALRQVLAAEAP
jgi:LysR family hydrogen peroxide-inducible transcriptional activator